MFTVTHEQPWDELETRIRAVSLLQPRNGETIYPYKNAQISLEDISYSDIRPTSLYVVRINLLLQGRLAEDLAVQGYDPLALGGLLTVHEAGKEPVGLLPPIAEETDEDGKYLLDGLHRAYLGWQANRATFKVIHIRGITPDYPAAARPNDWTEVIEYDSVPDDPHLKRRYRMANYLSLRRDFSALNGSEPRLG
ncbi:MAG TPA: hypothetical protein VLG13_03050 [Patescibacteria group bacterium]|nr:hypothetical protein [Patescibacteria group bacterium]